MNSIRGTGLVFLVAIFFGVNGCATAKKSVSKAEHAKLLVDIANGALFDGDSTSALQTLADAEKEAPNMPEIYHLKGLAFYMRQDLSRAIQETKHAIELKPGYSEAQNSLGKFYMDAGKYAEAQEPLNAAASDVLFRESFKAYTNLGILHYRQGDFKASREALDKAISASPNLACVAYYYRGHLALRASKFKDAVRDYDLATRKFCASFTDAHLALGIAYQHSKQYGLARKKFLEIQQRFPDTQTSEQAVSRLRELP